MNLLIDTSPILLRPISNVFTHRAPRPRAIYEAIRMFASESFCHVAAPAHRPMSFKQFRKFLRRHIAPLNGSVVRTPERRPMIVPIQMLNRLLAIYAGPASIPLLDKIPHVTAFRVLFDLAEALSSAVLMLWPARTLVEPEVQWSAPC